MENAKIKLPRHQLLKKKVNERLLLEYVNRSSFFANKGGGYFYRPQSESGGECDAIGVNGYCIDFKLLISQDGAKNMNETKLAYKEIRSGVTISQPSKASQQGIKSLPFPNIWGFLATDSLRLNDDNEFILKEKEDSINMKGTIKSFNKMIRAKKNLLFFFPNEFVIEHFNSIEIVCNKAKDNLSLISKARAFLSPKHETYYVLLVNNKLVLFSESVALIEYIDLALLSVEI